MKIVFFCAIFYSTIGYCLSTEFGESFKHLHELCKNKSIENLDAQYEKDLDRFIGSFRRVINTHGRRAVYEEHIVGNNITTINKSHLRFVWKRLNKPDVKIKMTESKALWRQINYDLDLVIYCPGWTTNFTKYEPVTVQLFAADFLNRGDVNFVAVDPADYIDKAYFESAYNTEIIGEAIAEALEELGELSENDIPRLRRRINTGSYIGTHYVEKRVHLIGFSMGAQIVAAAGRALQNLENRLRVPRITGLDPAHVCFEPNLDGVDAADGILQGLSKYDGEFVDIIHTNALELGIGQPVGDVDFYPNGGMTQPGCSDNFRCSHERAYKLYSETISRANENKFMAKRWCSADEDKDTCKLRNEKEFAMGYGANSEYTRVFFT